MSALLLVALKLLPVAGIPVSAIAGARGWLRKPIAIACAVGCVIALLLLIRQGGERAGAQRTIQKVEAAHAAAIADSRHDERLAADASTTIATSTAQQAVASAAVTRFIIEDMHHAIDAVPPAAPGAALPAAPVDGLRASLNAGIARAGRAADAADALP